MRTEPLAVEARPACLCRNTASRRSEQTRCPRWLRLSMTVFGLRWQARRLPSSCESGSECRTCLVRGISRWDKGQALTELLALASWPFLLWTVHSWFVPVKRPQNLERCAAASGPRHRAPHLVLDNAPSVRSE